MTRPVLRLRARRRRARRRVRPGRRGRRSRGIAFPPDGYPDELRRRPVLRRLRGRLHVRAARRARTANPDPATVALFARRPAGTGGPVELQAGPGGDLYYTRSTREHPAAARCTASASWPGQAPPAPVAVASPTAGRPPLAVDVLRRRPADPGGHALTYEWDLDGDGELRRRDRRAGELDLHAAGHVRVSVRATDAGGATGTGARDGHGRQHPAAARDRGARGRRCDGRPATRSRSAAPRRTTRRRWARTRCRGSSRSTTARGRRRLPRAPPPAGHGCVGRVRGARSRPSLAARPDARRDGLRRADGQRDRAHGSARPRRRRARRAGDAGRRGGSDAGRRRAGGAVRRAGGPPPCKAAAAGAPRVAAATGAAPDGARDLHARVPRRRAGDAARGPDRTAAPGPAVAGPAGRRAARAAAARARPPRRAARAAARRPGARGPRPDGPRRRRPAAPRQGERPAAPTLSRPGHLGGTGAPGGRPRRSGRHGGAVNLPAGMATRW